MVRASVEIPRSKAAAASIEGGFVLVGAASLMAAWRACRTRPLGVGDFRAWLACREMVARRCSLVDGRAAAYTPAELADLLGVGRRRAGAALGRLEAAGLVAWSDSAIAFPDPVAWADDGLADTIGRGRGSVAVPRRILRLLAAGARPALIATALGVLLRCLSRRRSGWDGRGRLKASWVAAAFGVDVRAVKSARRELVELGWITPEPADQWSLNRWGRAYRIDLRWGDSPGIALSDSPINSGSLAEGGSPSSGDFVSRLITRESAPRLPPPAPILAPRLPPPESNREPLRELRHQEPGQAGPAGVRPDRVRETQRAPRLNDVKVDDLRDTGRLLALHDQAVDRGLVSSSEADRMRVVAAAEHALAIGRANPPGLFSYLIRGRCWRYLTGADEDRAGARLRAHLQPPCPPGGRRPVVPAAAPSDAEVVRAVRTEAIRAGIYRDPFPEFVRLNPGWSRERWDRALAGPGDPMAVPRAPSPSTGHVRPAILVPSLSAMTTAGVRP
jgi:hypothetical protein